MIVVDVKKQSDYPISIPKIKKSLREFLETNGVVSDSYVGVAIVGEERMKKLARKYLTEKDVVHNVLSFTESEVKCKFMYPPDKGNILGEIIVCYPKAVDEAGEEGKLIDDKVIELLEHGAMHLLGVHHD